MVVEWKCPSCGGLIKYNENMSIITCKYCGTQYSVRDIIHNYNTYFISEGDVEVIDADYKAALVLMENGDYEAAEKIFSRLRNEFPSDYRGYLGYCILYTHNFSEESAKKIARMSANSHWEKCMGKQVTSKEFHQRLETISVHKNDVVWPAKYQLNMKNAIALANSEMISDMFSRFASRCKKYHEIYFLGKQIEMNKQLEIIRREERKKQCNRLRNERMYRRYTLLTVGISILGLLALVYVVVNAGVIPEEGNERLFRFMFGMMILLFWGASSANGKRRTFKE